MENRVPSLESNFREKCTVIESMQGKAKLIMRDDESVSNLVTLNFHNLKDCLEFVAKNQFQVSTLYSGIKRGNKAKE